jgi:polysaccharide export outer membrane protein
MAQSALLTAHCHDCSLLIVYLFKVVSKVIEKGGAMILNHEKAAWLLLLVLVLTIQCSNPPASTPVVNPQNPGGAPVNPAVNDINRSLSLMAAQSINSSADYRIGPDDLLQVTIYNIPEKDASVTPRTVALRVSQEGIIVVPLIGTVSAKGMTTGELEKDLAKRYEKYIRNPSIGVMVAEYRQRVSVMGAVQKAGVFELNGPRTVMDMLALAGGLSDRAGNQVHVYREDGKGGRLTYVIDLMVLANTTGLIMDEKNAAMVNMAVQAGDVVNVPQSGMFFVDGAVLRPGSYPLGRNYTLSQALATAGGVNIELADASAITIYRRRGPEKVENIPVDLDKVKAGEATDPQVQPDDLISVPMSGFKYFVKRFIGTIISGTSVGSIAAGS